MKPKPLQNDVCGKTLAIKWPDRVTPLKKTILVGPLYTRSRAENASIKWPDRVTPLKKHQSMLVGPAPEQRML